MKVSGAILMVVLALPALVIAAGAQENARPAQAEDQTAPASEATDKNMQEYAELMRTNIRQRKAQIMAEVMQLSAADAAKFWPIYNEYDTALDRLSDSKVANIQEYARTYNQMTNDKADELVHNMIVYQRQRAELIAAYYEKFKGKLGAITAARFIQVEDQLLLIIDLQIDSSLPIVGQADMKVAHAQGVAQ
ncbi:MAG: hypothetical protein JOZ83_13250 [Silvibacterium sp.]|nr:hypothetical protein [Silvibacterium sp.]